MSRVKVNSRTGKAASSRVASAQPRGSTRAKHASASATTKKTALRPRRPAALTVPAGVRRPGLLEGLGLVGLDSIEPVVLAAVAAELPLLLIGRHGTAKSWMLERLAEALGLTWRHYNASLLNYDDLVGYPLPDEQGRLRFIETPASIWGAEAVFIDEISRCRPDMQNRIFPIIHERRVQGMALAALRHRWAAMNPPATDDDAAGEEVYAGSEPLDAALADRFPLVIEMPDWEGFSDRDKDALIRLAPGPVSKAGVAALRAALARARASLAPVEEALGPVVADYVRIVTGLVRPLGLRLSGRRARMLYGNVVAIHAARLALAAAPEPGDSAWLTLAHGLPQLAQGIRIDRPRLLVAHNEAWRLSGLDRLDPRRLLIAEPDPVRRAVMATHTPGLSSQELSAWVADGLAEAPAGARHALALHVLGSPAVARLNAAIAEQVAELAGLPLVAQDVSTQVPAGKALHKVWQRIEELLAGLDPADAETSMLGNLLGALFNSHAVQQERDVAAVVEGWHAVRALTAAAPVEGCDAPAA